MVVLARQKRAAEQRSIDRFHRARRLSQEEPPGQSAGGRPKYRPVTTAGMVERITASWVIVERLRL